MKLHRYVSCVALAAAALNAVPVAAATLYDEAAFKSLTSDRNGRRVGDLVTVLIGEDASAVTTTDTSAGRDADVGLSIQGPSHARRFGLASTNNFEGRGSTERSGRVLGQLTVAVREVLANGDLVLGGTQELEINGERQLIKLDGRVRPQDLSGGNTVASTRVADAHISFIGNGTLAERQKPSWWHQLLTWFGL